MPKILTEQQLDFSNVLIRPKRHGCGGRIIVDGGITCPGDMAKAFGAGADYVMMGGQFAGHDQNPGEVIEENEQLSIIRAQKSI